MFSVLGSKCIGVELQGCTVKSGLNFLELTILPKLLYPFTFLLAMYMTPLEQVLINNHY